MIMTLVFLALHSEVAEAHLWCQQTICTMSSALWILLIQKYHLLLYLPEILRVPLETYAMNRH